MRVTFPVETVDLSMQRLGQSSGNLPVTLNSNMSTDVQAGEYIIQCTARGSNPAPLVLLILDDVTIEMSMTTTRAIANGRPIFEAVGQTVVLLRPGRRKVSCFANLPSHMQAEPRYADVLTSTTLDVTGEHNLGVSIRQTRVVLFAVFIVWYI